MQGAIFPICISKGEGPHFFSQSGRGKKNLLHFSFFRLGAGLRSLLESGKPPKSIKPISYRIANKSILSKNALFLKKKLNLIAVKNMAPRSPSFFKKRNIMTKK